MFRHCLCRRVCFKICFIFVKIGISARAKSDAFFHLKMQQNVFVVGDPPRNLLEELTELHRLPSWV